MSYQDSWILFDNDINKLLDFLKHNYVNWGLSVSEQSTPAMGVTVSAGDCYINGTYVNKESATNVSLDAADATNPRKDLIVINESGTISVVKGTAEAASPSGETGPKTSSPKPPNIPADSLVLAEVWVGAGVSAIYNADITDRRVLGPQDWPFNLGELLCSAMIVGNNVGPQSVWRYWPETKHIQLHVSTGSQPNNQGKFYLQTFRHVFGFGKYQMDGYDENFEEGRFCYFGFESPIGGYSVHPPSGTYAGAIFFEHVQNVGGAEVKQVRVGYNGSYTTSGITWDTTTEQTLKIEWGSSQADFYVGTTNVASITTNIPQKPMPWFMEIRQDSKSSDYTNSYYYYERNFKRYG